MPVEEYPIEKKTEEDEDSSMQADTSLYKEDGSLEVYYVIETTITDLVTVVVWLAKKESLLLQVEFSSLLDVRSIKTSSSDVLEVANKPDQSATNVKLSTNSNGLQTTVKGNFSNNLDVNLLYIDMETYLTWIIVKTAENGKGDPWEELSEALSEKKAKLCEANKGWNKKGSSRRGSWRRGSGMGPLMNYLRSQKEI